MIIFIYLTIILVVRTFGKLLTTEQINEFIQEDNMKYLIIEYSGEKYYAFNLLDGEEYANAISIIQDTLDFMVMGWKVALVIPTWVLGYSDWKDFMSSLNASPTNQEDGKPQAVVDVNAIYDGIDWDNKQIEQARIESADPIYVGDGLFQGDMPKNNGIVDINESNTATANTTSVDQGVTTRAQVINPYSNVKIEFQRSNGQNKFDVDDDVFDLCGGNFKEELSTNISKSVKTNMLDVYVTGPFINQKTGKSHYVVVFGAFLKAWPLKDAFLRGYLKTLANKLNSVKNAKIDTNHCLSYTEINIRKNEFGKESLWRRLAPKNGKIGNTIKRMSFVVTVDTKLGNNGFLVVKEAIDFLTFSMKKREKNPVGVLLLDYLKDNAQGLYNHLMNGSVSEDLVAEKLTNDMDAQFIGGYSISSNNWLNHFMVDYDIIRILKDYVGYSSWSDVPISERGYCYRGYNSTTSLPDWHIEEEKYNK